MSTTTEEKRDVLTRLDSLLARGQEVESGPNSVTSSSSTCSSTPSSILKTSKGTVKKKLSFPEDNIQEVIGYGGDDTYSSDEDDAGPPAASKRLETNETVDEMTTEEKVVGHGSLLQSVRDRQWYEVRCGHLCRWNDRCDDSS